MKTIIIILLVIAALIALWWVWGYLNPDVDDLMKQYGPKK